eukprot:TRINITY_DN14064_c0_g3_i1.p1 TRINITY_DN14064_c0_g3~~TRINITY_DN14064_c0_g3_i1.p1  ORF type:complete len:313 (+),score=49.85 TRINITY_DN14064_c0_g3_i1:152-1090(+)
MKEFVQWLKLCWFILAADSAEASDKPAMKFAQMSAVLVLNDVVDTDDLNSLRSLARHGTSFATWWEPAAGRLLNRVADRFDIGERYLEDIAFSSALREVVSNGNSQDWDAVVVMYLGEERINVSLIPRDAAGSWASPPSSVLPGVALLAFDGEGFKTDSAEMMLWVRVRRRDVAPRSLFNFYVATWVRHHFVAPRRNGMEQKFLSSHTRHPVFWHNFIWSFIGVFCSVLSILPVAWQAVVLYEVRASNGVGKARWKLACCLLCWVALLGLARNNSFLFDMKRQLRRKGVFVQKSWKHTPAELVQSSSRCCTG